MPDTHWQGGHEKVDNGDDCNAVTQYLVRTRVRQNGRHLKESVPAASHSPAPARNLLDCKIFHSPGSVPHSPVFGMLFCPPWCCGSGPLMSSATGEFYHGMPKNLAVTGPLLLLLSLPLLLALRVSLTPSLHLSLSLSLSHSLSLSLSLSPSLSLSLALSLSLSSISLALSICFFRSLSVSFVPSRSSPCNYVDSYENCHVHVHVCV